MRLTSLKHVTAAGEFCRLLILLIFLGRALVLPALSFCHTLGSPSAACAAPSAALKSQRGIPHDLPLITPSSGHERLLENEPVFFSMLIVSRAPVEAWERVCSCLRYVGVELGSIPCACDELKRAQTVEESWYHFESARGSEMNKLVV